MTLYLAIAGFWLCSVVLAIFLCRAAARGDQMLGYKDPDPYLSHERRLRVHRALQREGVYPIDAQGRKRLGMDS